MTTVAPDASALPPSAPEPPVPDVSPNARSSEVPSDPHASKISPDDPRLRLRGPRGRTLKKGPAIALLIGGLGLVTVSVVLALLPPSKPAESKKQEPEPSPAQAPPAVPESLRTPPPRDGPTAIS